MAIERGFDNHYSCRCDRPDCAVCIEFDVANVAKTTSYLRHCGWSRFDYRYPAKGRGNGHYCWSCPEHVSMYVPQ